MKNLLKKELLRVGSKHISKTTKANQELFDFVIETTKNIQIKNISQQIFLILNELEENPKCYCGRDLKFNSFVKGFSEYCSKKCARNSPKTKENFNNKIASRTQADRDKINQKKVITVKENYGVENISQHKEIQDKKIETFQEHYGVDFGFQSPIIKQHIKETNLKRYGAEDFLSSDKAKEAIKNTNLKKYGVENPMQNKEIKNKAMTTTIEKYGGIGFQVDKGQFNKINYIENHEKSKKTIMERYGVEYAVQNINIKSKIKKTIMERYGVEYASQNQEINKKIQKQNN